MEESLQITIPRQHWDEMRHHVEFIFPEEACGMVGGKDQVASMVIPVMNELHSYTAYRMAPEEQLRALLTLEDGGLDLLAIFHSHPSGPAHPSHTDIEQFAYPGTITLIWSHQSGIWKVRGFQIVGDDVYPVEVITRG